MKAILKSVLSRVIGIRYRQVAKTPTVYLTFDDGPTRHTSMMLELLSKYSVTATFFILGKRIQGNEDVLREVYSAGHSIGNHSFSHIDANKLGYTQLRADLDHCSHAIQQVLPNWQPRLFRPPFGHLSVGYVRHTLVRRGTIVMWSLDSLDYRAASGTVICNTLNGLRPSDIVLFHDEFPATVSALSQIIPKYLDQGYAFSRL